MIIFNSNERDAAMLQQFDAAIALAKIQGFLCGYLAKVLLIFNIRRGL